MKLSDYLATPGAITVSALARKLKVSRQAVYNMTEGATPTLKRAAQIEKLTDGNVTLYDWFGIEPKEKAEETLDSLF